MRITDILTEDDKKKGPIDDGTKAETAKDKARLVAAARGAYLAKKPKPDNEMDFVTNYIRRDAKYAPSSGQTLESFKSTAISAYRKAHVTADNVQHKAGTKETGRKTPASSSTVKQAQKGGDEGARARNAMKANASEKESKNLQSKVNTEAQGKTSKKETDKIHDSRDGDIKRKTVDRSTVDKQKKEEERNAPLVDAERKSKEENKVSDLAQAKKDAGWDDMSASERRAWTLARNKASKKKD